MSDDSDQRGKADDLEQRYVNEQVETEAEVEGLDPENPDPDKRERVEASGDDEGAAHVERMAGEK